MVTRLSCLVLATLALGLVACPCGGGRDLLLYEGFDALCEGAPCAWELDGEVASVATLHPGERGIRVEGGAALEREVTGFDNPSAEDSVDVVVRCEASTSARFILVMTTDGETEIAISAATPVVSGASSGFVRFAAPLLQPGAEASPGGRPLRVRVEVVGPGACVIDELFFFRGAESECFG